jgi:hypothetical protein
LRYAGQYVRRPLIAQRRFLEINDREVVFLAKMDIPVKVNVDSGGKPNGVPERG